MLFVVDCIVLELVHRSKYGRFHQPSQELLVQKLLFAAHLIESTIGVGNSLCCWLAQLV